LKQWGDAALNDGSTDGGGIAALVGQTAVSDLLPPRLVVEGTQLPDALQLQLAAQLGPSKYLVVVEAPSRDVRAAAQLFVVPAIVEEGRLRRAVPGDGAAEALVARLTSAEPTNFEGLACERFPRAAYEEFSPRGERSLPVDQTHESVVVGETAVVKWQVSATPTPAPTLVAHLAANGFVQMPGPWGFVSWNNGEDDVLLASVTDFLPGATDGWEWMVADLSQFATGGIPMAEALVSAGAIGGLVVRLHVALAASSQLIASPRRLATVGEREGWCERDNASLRDALTCVEGEASQLLNERSDAIEACFRSIRASRDTTVIPVHGDLHVGQILRWEGGYAVNDFDGNPILTAKERMAPEPVARDVAGMLQSLDHVGRVVLRRTTGANPSRVIDWIAESQQQFLDCYRTHLGECGVLSLLDESLLFPFRVEQECREFIYAHRHLPRWGYVPAGAIQSLLP
jgi:maltokinase